MRARVLGARCRRISPHPATGEIAAELVVSEKTVKGHTGNLFVKLQVEDRTQAAVFAGRTGIVHAQR